MATTVRQVNEAARRALGRSTSEGTVSIAVQRLVGKAEPDLVVSQQKKDPVHASPRALMDMAYAEHGPDEVDEIVAADDVRIMEAAGMAIVLFLELWALLPNAPALETRLVARWTGTFTEIARAVGAPFPPPETS